MLFKDIFGNAKYVAGVEYEDLCYIRKTFNVPFKIKKAQLLINCLGFCEIFCNEKKVNKDLYVTPLSQYNLINKYAVNMCSCWDDFYFQEKLGFTNYVSRYDLTEFCNKGKNGFGVSLAGGWYKSGMDKYKSFRDYGRIGVCFVIIIEGIKGELVKIYSDENCKYRRNFLLVGGIFHEEQDERLEISDFSNAFFDDKNWGNVEILSNPLSDYVIESFPKQNIIEYIKPKKIKEGSDYVVYDVGRNITGYPIIETESVVNAKISCIFSEEITEDNDLDLYYVFDQYTTFVTDGRKEHYLRFTWHGFRYFKICFVDKGLNVNCNTVVMVHNDIKNTSTFVCNDENINWIYNAYISTQLQNYQCGVPTDCPQIERKGYTGDGQLLSKIGMMLFDSKVLYKKWLRDISDSQDQITGCVSYTAPIFIGVGGGPGGWGCSIVNVPYNYYKMYGDIDVLKEFFPKMIKYIEFLSSNSEDGLVVHCQKGAWCLGDWATPTPVKIPPEYVNTCFACISIKKILAIAGIIDCHDYDSFLTAQLNTFSDAVVRKFYNVNTGDFCDNVQGANCFAIEAGIGHENTIKNLYNKYTHSCLDTGIFGTYFLADCLCKYGYHDLFFDLITSDKGVSYVQWKNKGATTLWEGWIEARSHNHPMFGSIVEFFFEYVLGIKQEKDSCCYNKITINPLSFEKISEASGSILTIKGNISVAFKKYDGVADFTIELPEGVSCRFSYNGIILQLKDGVNRFSI